MQIAVGYENNVGNYVISVKGTGADGKERAVQFYLAVLQAGQAGFVVENLTIAPPEIKEGEAVSISIAVKNVGELEGTYTATLKINGVAVENKSITLAAGASGQATFTFTGTAPGTYVVSLGGMTGTFTVKPGITPPENVENEIIVAENLIIKENEPVSLEVENADVFRIRIQSVREVCSAKVTVQQLTVKPAEVFSPSGEVYSYFTIIAENVQERDLREVTLFFQLKRSWMHEHGFSENDMVLLRYNFSTRAWNALETRKIGENEEHMSFSASSPGLSLYAIVGAKPVPITSPAAGEEGKEISPYLLAGSCIIVGVLVASVLIYRRRSRGEETLKAPSKKEKPAKEEKWEF
jgi:PGF-pre-PGF domain-containing protein